MARNDRLFDLIQVLRDGHLHTARSLSERAGVSVRTIWRDMATLAEAGLPVQGERGVGYLLRGPVTLPPMILTEDEAEALRQGLAHVAAGPDAHIARAAQTLAARIAAAMPPLADP